MAKDAAVDPSKAKQSTKPGDPAPAAKKEKVAKVWHPSLEPDKDGKPTKQIDDFPADYDPKVHKTLTRKNFTNEAPLLERRGKELIERGNKLLKEATDCRTLGSAQQRQAAKKLRHVRDQFEKMKKVMEEQGLDWKTILGSMESEAAAPAAK